MLDNQGKDVDKPGFKANVWATVYATVPVTDEINSRWTMRQLSRVATIFGARDRWPVDLAAGADTVGSGFASLPFGTFFLEFLELFIVFRRCDS